MKLRDSTEFSRKDYGLEQKKNGTMKDYAFWQQNAFAVIEVSKSYWIQGKIEDLMEMFLVFRRKG